MLPLTVSYTQIVPDGNDGIANGVYVLPSVLTSN